MLDDFYIKMMNNSGDSPETRKIRRVVECGLQTALFVILALIGSTVPIFGILAFMCYPTTIMFLTIRYGILEGVLASVAAFALISLLLSPFTALRIIILCAPLGILLGFGVKEKWTYFKLICLSTLAAALLLMVIIYAVSVLLGEFPVPNFVLFPAYHQLSISGAAPDSVDAMQRFIWESLCLGWPTILFVAGLMMVLPALFWNTRLLKKLGTDIRPPSLDSFEEFRLPAFFTVLGALSIVSLFFGIYLESGPLYQFGFNFTMISALFGAVSGAALYWWYAKIKHWHIAVKLIGFIVIMSINILGELLVLLGLLDPVLDIRSRIHFAKAEKQQL